MSDRFAFGLVGERLILAPGSTLAVFMDPVAGQGNWKVKYLSGGTLEIVGASLGSTLSQASLAGLSGSGYLMGATEALDIDGPARFYLMAHGATTFVTLLREKTSGT